MNPIKPIKNERIEIMKIFVTSFFLMGNIEDVNNRKNPKQDPCVINNKLFE